MRLILCALFAAALLCAGCERNHPAAGPGPQDPIPGPAGAVAPAGNTVPGSGLVGTN